MELTNERRKNMIYKWKTNYHKVKPEIAGAELERIENTVGLTAKNVVMESRPQNAPLHKEFTWDDSKAAEKYREQEARTLIGDIVIEIDGEAKQVITRGFVNLSTPSNRVSEYESINKVLIDEEKTTALLESAKREMKCFKAKYSTLKELAGVFNEIDKIIG